MTTAADFLLARYAEDEAVARAAETATWASTVAEQTHILRWDPDAVLADVAAKRRIVELCATWIAEGERHVGGRDVVSIASRAQAITAETVLRALVQPHVEHPDFDEAWRA